MALLNYATKEITIKIVYYGPGLSGKTTNLQYMHTIFEPSRRGKLLSLATEADRTLFFDILPVELGKISDFSIRFQLYTVPGQVRYNATRKLVLKGADAVVFVADSQREIREQNVDSLKNMRENLLANHINPDEIPVIIQFNKRDLTNIMSVDEMNRDLNEHNRYKFREAIAIKGTGVEETFQEMSRLVIEGIAKKHKIKLQPSEENVELPHAEMSSKDVRTEKALLEEAFAEIPTIESFRYDSPETDRPDQALPELKTEHVLKILKEEAPLPREIIVKEIKEVPVIPKEKLDGIVNGITEISQTLRELKNVLSSVHSEIKDMKKEQKETNSMLRDIMNTVENIKVKKGWFRFL
jgi:signal recognition particle receptor subunit beta